MLQYLINTSAIWLISLVLFDVFLRRESFHSYNRLYLLSTFVLGLVLPLVQWQGTDHHYARVWQEPVQQVIAAKQTIVAASAREPLAANWLTGLGMVYIAGALIALVLLLADVYKLAQYYRNSIRSLSQAWTIAETMKDHPPFSLRNMLFVNSVDQYSAEEWQMILANEGRHTTLWHMADVALMQLARIVFWFHPLVYLYNKRLVMVHEYQADSTTQPVQVYGNFLIEQSMLHAAPAITHSFNRSPIKNRIIMLSRKSSATARTKMLVVLPIALVCFLCFSKNGLSQQEKVTKDIVFTLGNLGTDPKKVFTWTELSANTTMVSNDENYTVREFELSIMPKGGEFRGPFKVKGNELTDKEKNILKEYSGTTCMVFIGAIHAAYKGRDVAIKYDLIYHVAGK